MSLRAVAFAVVLFAAFGGLLAPSPASAADVPVTLVAAGFEWHRNNPSTPAAPTITVNAGDNLNLTVENQDSVVHTFTFPHFGVDMSLAPGGAYLTNITTTLADAGTWQFWCQPHSSGTDPENHSGMVGWFELLGPPDSTPPTIGSVAPAPGPNVVGAPIRIEANVTDNVAVQTVALNYTDTAGANHNVTMALDGGVYVATIPAPTAPGNILYFVYARDAAGNEAVSSSSTLTVSPPAADYTLAVVVAIILVAFLLFAVFALRRKKT